MCENPLEQWVLKNKEKEGFEDSLVKLLSYACINWIFRETKIPLTGTAGLAWFLAKAPSKYSIGDWLENPQNYTEKIIEFCEKSKTEKIPECLKMEFPTVLDLRGVKCPKNAVRSRLVMSGYPMDKILTIYLDEGSPIENVPQSLVADNIDVLSREKKGDYWALKVVKHQKKV